MGTAGKESDLRKLHGVLARSQTWGSLGAGKESDLGKLGCWQGVRLGEAGVLARSQT